MGRLCNALVRPASISNALARPARIVTLLLSAACALAPLAPRRRTTRLSKGAFPEQEFSATPRRSLRGVWRLRRTCDEDRHGIDDIVVTLKASGTFSAAYFPSAPAAEDVAKAREAFAAKLSGRWYSDGDDREVRLARFERQSPVEWYTATPADDALLGAFAGHVTYGASSPEWIGRFEMEPLWPDTHAALPPPPERAPRFRNADAVGAWYLVCRGGTSSEDAVLYDLRLYANRTWETVDGFDGSASRREAGVAVNRRLDAESMRGVLGLERAAAKETRAGRDFLRAALGEDGSEERAAKLAGTWDLFDEDDGLDFFAGAPGEGRSVFLWCRRFGNGATRVSTGVSIDSDLLFVGVVDGDGTAAAAEGVLSVGWNAEPCFVGGFTMTRADA